MWEEIKTGGVEGSDLKEMTRPQKIATVLLVFGIAVLLIALPHIPYIL